MFLHLHAQQGKGTFAVNATEQLAPVGFYHALRVNFFNHRFRQRFTAFNGTVFKTFDDLSASLKRPFEASQRGDSGKKNRKGMTSNDGTRPTINMTFQP